MRNNYKTINGKVISTSKSNEGDDYIKISIQDEMKGKTWNYDIHKVIEIQKADLKALKVFLNGMNI